jgi:hypothetical protein
VNQFDAFASYVENTGIWLKFCETWLLKRGSAEHATNSLIVPTILIGWLPSSNSHLKLPLEGFAPVKQGFGLNPRRRHCYPTIGPVGGRPRAGAANFRHFRLPAPASADVSASAWPSAVGTDQLAGPGRLLQLNGGRQPLLAVAAGGDQCAGGTSLRN